MGATTGMQGIVYSLAASPDFIRDGVCFAACESGLFRSDNGGLTWHSAYDPLVPSGPLAITAVAVSPNFGDDHCVFAGAHGVILRSVDGGQRWESASLPLPPPQVSFLAVSPDFARDGTVLAATLEDGVFRSVDRGRSWHSANFGLMDLNALTLVFSADFTSDATVFVGTDSGIFRSKNGGLAWREVAFPPHLAPVLSLAVPSNDSSGGVLLAGTDSSGLYRSEDRGASWVRMGQDAIVDAVNAIFLSSGPRPAADLLVLTGDVPLVSHDGGLTWRHWRADLALRNVTCMAAPEGLGAGACLLVGLADGGVLRI